MSQSYTYNLIKSIGICNSIKKYDLKAHNYFMKLFTTKYIPDDDENPDKIVGLVDFKIVRQKMDSTKLEMGIIKENGTEDSISWLSCYDGPASNREKLVTAMIVAVHNHPKEVERRKTTFPYIDSFLKNNEPPQYFDKNEYNQRVFRIIDSEFKEKWKIYYHNNNKHICNICSPIKEDNDGWTIVR